MLAAVRTARQDRFGYNPGNGMVLGVGGLWLRLFSETGFELKGQARAEEVMKQKSLDTIVGQVLPSLWGVSSPPTCFPCAVTLEY